MHRSFSASCSSTRPSVFSRNPSRDHSALARMVLTEATVRRDERNCACVCSTRARRRGVTPVRRQGARGPASLPGEEPTRGRVNAHRRIGARPETRGPARARHHPGRAKKSRFRGHAGTYGQARASCGPSATRPKRAASATLISEAVEISTPLTKRSLNSASCCSGPFLVSRP